jgi:PsbN protein
MEPATVLSISLGVAVIAVTAYAIYVSFGPPAKELRDPFEEHED